MYQQKKTCPYILFRLNFKGPNNGLIEISIIMTSNHNFVDLFLYYYVLSFYVEWLHLRN